MVRSSGLSLLVLFVAITLSSSSLHSQATSDTDHPLVFRSNVRTVVVDVVVTGKDGQPVRGLQKEDFLASEDGHAQKVTSFEEHTGSQALPANLPSWPPNVFSNVPRVATTDSVTVLLLDSLNTPMAAQARVHAQMLKYMKQLQPGRRYAIFALGRELRYIQGFTDDPALLAAALKNPARGTAGPQSSPLLSSYSESNAAKQAVTRIGAASLADFLAKQEAFESDERVLMTLDAFQGLAKYLSAIPGRKNVVWFSSAFPAVTFSNPSKGEAFDIQRSYGDAFRQTDTLLSAAQVAIYPIAAEGLASDSLFDIQHDLPGVTGSYTAQVASNKDLNDEALARNGIHTTMDEIARDTGGEAIYDTNGLNDALDRASNHGASYYTLYYTPTNTAVDGQYRKIQVKLVSGSYKLAYRRGYYAAEVKNLAASPASSGVDPMLRSMIPGLPDSSQIPFALRILPGSTTPAASKQADASTRGQDCAGDNHKLEGPLTRYAIDFVIAARGMQLDPASDGGRQGRIEVTLVAYDQYGKALNWLVRQVDLTMDAARFAQVQANGVNLHFDLDVPKDGATLRSGVYDWRSQMAGTLEIPFSSVASPSLSTASVKK